MSIIRYEPWVLMNRLHRDLDRLFSPSNGEEQQHSVVDWAPPADIREEEKQFVIHADLPGVEPKNIDVSLEKGVLTIRGRRDLESRDEERLPPRRAGQRRVFPSLQPARHRRRAVGQGALHQRRSRSLDPEAGAGPAAPDQCRGRLRPPLTPGPASRRNFDPGPGVC
jgi:hypothetical protein